MAGMADRPASTRISARMPTTHKQEEELRSEAEGEEKEADDARKKILRKRKKTTISRTTKT